MRKSTFVLGTALLGLSVGNIFANVYLTDNFDSGWIDSNGVHIAGNQNYASGFMSPTDPVADYFSFSLAGLSGTVSSASVNLASYTIDAPGTFDIYATSLNPAQVNSSVSFISVADYEAIVSSPVIGSIALSPADNGTIVTIGLNAAGASWLQANEGGSVVLGGYFDTTPPSNCAFCGSNFTDTNNLTISTASTAVTPEPNFTVVGAALFTGMGLVALLRRKSVARSTKS